MRVSMGGGRIGAAISELEVEASERDDEVDALRVMLGEEDADAADCRRGKAGYGGVGGLDDEPGTGEGCIVVAMFDVRRAACSSAMQWCWRLYTACDVVCHCEYVAVVVGR